MKKILVFVVGCLAFTGTLAQTITGPIVPLPVPQSQGGTGATDGNWSATSIDVSSTAAPYRYSGSVVARYPLDSNSEYQLFLGRDAATGWTSGAILATCLGTHTCGSGGAGMTGVENTLVGWSNGFKFTTAANNTTLGVNVLGAQVTGNNNVGIGQDAMRDVDGVNGSVAVGAMALRNMGGNSNVGVGLNVMEVGTGTVQLGTGTQNTSVGSSSMSSTSLTSATNNSVYGFSAGTQLTTGSRNTLLGTRAGNTTLATGNDNIVVGYNRDTPAAGTNSYLTVGDLITGDLTNIGTIPTLNVDASTASAATGIKIKAAAAAGGVALSVQSSGTNENLTVDAKGSGTITLGGTSTGNIIVSRVMQTNAIKGTAASSVALYTGPNGGTNPSFNVDTSTASAATGVNIKSAAAGAGVAVSAISSGTNENLTLDAKGTGTITLNGTATGNVIAGAPIVRKGYTVATLPTGATGAMAYVSDAVTCTFLGTLTGGGALFCPVTYNGSGWVPD